MNKPTVVCTKCAWVSFAVTKAHAEAEVKTFNKYYATLSKRDQESYRGEATIDSYTCQLCGGSTFRLAKPEEIPFGSTINPVIWEDPDMNQNTPKTIQRQEDPDADQG